MTSEQIDDDDTFTRTSVLRAHFGDSYKVWIWIRKQFTPASLGVIVSVVLAAGGYIIHLRETVSEVTTRVIVLETRVVPVLEQADKTVQLETELTDVRQRIVRLEADWDNASEVATIPNDKLLRQKRRLR